MTEPEPEAELLATANLSPVSPSPVHTAAPLVVPALQDTVDTIDAMVAAAVGPDGSTVDDTSAADMVIDPAMAPADLDGDGEDVVDDDSFNDAYAEEAAQEPALESKLDEDADVNDDYAKTFDSPIGSQEGDEMDNQQDDVTSVPSKSNDSALPSQTLNNFDTLSSSASAAPSSTIQLATNSSSAGPEVDAGTLATITSQPSEQPRQIDDANSTHSQPSTAAKPVDTEPQGSSVDIQKLVADLTAPPVELVSNNDPSASPAKDEPPAGSASMTPSALPSPSSLPPRPPLPHTVSQSYAAQHHPGGSNPGLPIAAVGPPTPGQPSTYVAAGAPGTLTDAISSLPPPPSTGLNASVPITSLNPPPHPVSAPGYTTDRHHDPDYQRDWDQFMTDERQYMSEARWDRFPDGSRIFIGNLSSDKVSKRDVFDMFHKYGRLAQISLKSAYGFVQYHTVEEGRRAMENLQGTEIKGRRIHLEISRVQEKGKKERRQSPERGRGRDGGGGGRKGSHRGRDDYRPERNRSPRRGDYTRDDGHGHDRAYYESGRGRGRSRSPNYERNDKNSYRRRSPSPYGRSRPDDLDLPRRYGADVPDVQVILQPDVSRDFVAWVEGAFKAKGLKTEVMYLHPRIPKDQVIQRQAVEGVHGVVDLDLRAQGMGRIPLQAFDRSGGTSNVRFDQYVDLDPNTAAEVVLRAKASGAAAFHQPYGGGASGYGAPAYGSQPQPTHGGPYSSMPPSNAYAPQQQPPPAAAAAEIAKLMGHVDNATLQQLLSAIQVNPQGAPGHPPAGSPPNRGPAANPSQQVDIQAILGSLNGNAPPQQPAPQQAQYGVPYGSQPTGQTQGRPADANAQVQNIMAQLARYRQ